MKKTIYLLLTMLFLSSSFLLLSCNKDDENTETATLSDTEKADLLQLREEEKLARDVYYYAYDKYGISVFTNISNSEQAHMDAVLAILNTYRLTDPASSMVGVFNNTTLQSLYNDLVAKVDLSEMDALEVGATIEDLDIYDIEEFIAKTDKTDILVMYESLMCGSRNHMRSFYSQITAGSGTYSPQYITQEVFNSIINSSKETCGQ